jgi:hypothetical protein
MNAVTVAGPSDCEFYHSIDLPGIGSIAGQWDLRGRFDDYVGNTDVRGKTFLDVGAAGGFLSFEAEKRGAVVTSFDADGPERYQYLPGHVPLERDRFDRFRRGYEFSHHQLTSKANLVLGDIYSLSERVPQHDVVLVGQILVHLRDPLSALWQASLAARDTLIITEGAFESDKPISVFLGDQTVYYAWWHLSDKLYVHWLDLLGFDVVTIARGGYTCLDDAMPGQSELWTFVAKRRVQ